jgi:hypothetical protein
MARRRPNAELRTREYLTEPEIEKMIAAVKGNRWAQCDATMLLVAFRHGLRVAELIDLRWDQIEFEHGRLHVRRAKNGTPSVHPIHGDELRALRKLQREQDPVSPFVFTTERGGPFSVSAFQRWCCAPARLRSSASPHIRICCGTPVASRWQTRAWIRAPFKVISATSRSSTRCAIPNCRRGGSRIFGANSAVPPPTIRAPSLLAGGSRRFWSRNRSAKGVHRNGAASANVVANFTLQHLVVCFARRYRLGLVRRRLIYGRVVLALLRAKLL